ncbi:SGNH/GDSL hydrolase family protein [Bradyrhizobium monzae]
MRKNRGRRGAWPSTGTLQRWQGAPGPSQSQARGPSHGRSGWVLQTQPLSPHTLQLITLLWHAETAPAGLGAGGLPGPSASIRGGAWQNANEGIPPEVPNFSVTTADSWPRSDAHADHALLRWEERGELPSAPRLLRGSLFVGCAWFPGDRSVDGIKRWAEAPPASIAFIMYGTNDFGNFGHRAEGIVDPLSFEANMRELVLRRKSAGSQVVLLTPPPLEDLDLDVRLEDCQRIVRQVAKQEDTRIVETAGLLKDVTSKWTDSTHLSAAANRTLAAGLAAMIEISGHGASNSRLISR